MIHCILALPPDCFRGCYEYLTLQEIIQFDESIVNRANRAIYYDLLQLSIYKLPSRVTKSTLKWAANRGIQLQELHVVSDDENDELFESFPNITTLSLYWRQSISNRLTQVLKCFPKLKILRLNFWRGSLLSLETLQLQYLEELSIEGACIDDLEHLLLTSLHCQKLLKISLLHCSFPSRPLEILTSIVPQLQSIVIKCQLSSFPILFENKMIMLKELVLPFHRFGDSECTTIMSNCPNLHHLDVSGSNITDDGLHMLLTNITPWMYLDFFMCSNLSEEGILSFLQKLNGDRSSLSPIHTLILPLISPKICTSILRYQSHLRTWINTSDRTLREIKYNSRVRTCIILRFSNSSERSIELQLLYRQLFFECFKSIVTSVPNLTMLKLIEHQHLKIAEAIHSVSPVVAFRFPKHSLSTDELLQLPMKLLHGLTSLDVSSSQLTDEILIQLSLTCKGLKSISLPHIHSSNCLCGLHETSRCSAIGLMTLFGGCQKLEEIDLSRCHVTNDLCLMVILDNCPQLHHIYLSIFDETTSNQIYLFPPSVCWRRK